MILQSKSKTIYVTQFFIKKLELAFMKKNFDTFRYVTFLCTKIHTLRKKQENVCDVFYKKIRTLSFTLLFIEFMKFGVEWGGGYI